MEFLCTLTFLGLVILGVVALGRSIKNVDSSTPPRPHQPGRDDDTYGESTNPDTVADFADNDSYEGGSDYDPSDLL